jgi:hypothetical protein
MKPRARFADVLKLHSLSAVLTARSAGKCPRIRIGGVTGHETCIWILVVVTPGVERLRTGACGVVVVVVSGGVTGSEMGRGIC